MRPDIKPFILIFLPFVTGVVCLCFGRYVVPLDEVFNAVISYATSTDYNVYERVVMNIRFPRIVLAGIIGAALAIAGATFQSTLSNPLASPDVIGISSASAFGAVLGIFFGLGSFSVQFLALGMGILAIFIVFGLCKLSKSQSILTIVLAGIIIAGVFTALISLIKYVADPLTQLPDIVYWLMGGLTGANYNTIATVAPFLIAGAAVIVLLRWRLNIISLSDEEIQAMGHSPRKLRWTFMIAATVLVAASVSVCGQIGWIGLVIPHIARLITGSDNTKVIPVSATIGATFLIICDTICRSLIDAEIPLSIVTALIGAPIFALLFMRRNNEWS